VGSEQAFAVCRRLFSGALILVVLAFGNADAARAAADDIETAGDILQDLLPAATAGALIGHRDTEGAGQFGESFALTLGTTYALKYVIDEKRPNGGHYSFPSGHTSSSFSCAEFLRERYGWEYGLPAYLAATFVGYSRVESRNHYAHDVAAGAAIGILSSYLFTTPFRGWQVALSGDRRSLGVTFSRAW
jgi:membrane-associated phospholipid phosphatase